MRNYTCSPIDWIQWLFEGRVVYELYALHFGLIAAGVSVRCGSAETSVTCDHEVGCEGGVTGSDGCQALTRRGRGWAAGHPGHTPSRLRPAVKHQSKQSMNKWADIWRHWGLSGLPQVIVKSIYRHAENNTLIWISPHLIENVPLFIYNHVFVIWNKITQNNM